MKLVHPKAELVWGYGSNVIPTPTRRIEIAARVSHKSEGKVCAGSDLNLVRKLLDLKHGAALEFHDVCVKFTVDRGISHELVRHRFCSFLQESTRFCNYGDGHVQFVYPYFVRDNPIFCFPDELILHGEEGVEHYIRDHVLPRNGVIAEWLRTMARLEYMYKTLLEQGCKPQGARSVLPNSLKTEVFCKTNLREWRLIFKLRCAKAAHPDIRIVMLQALEMFKATIPVVFDDLAEEFLS